MLAALTQTKNAYPNMPERVEDLFRLSGRLDDIRQANIEHHLDLIASAANLGVEVLCMGELFSGPYFALDQNPMWWGMAEDAEEGPSVQRMREAAAKHSMLLIAPIYEQDSTSGKRFNTAVVIENDGSILGKYRKTHIPAGSNDAGSFHETFYYDRGDGNLGSSPCNVSSNPHFPVFDTSVGKVGVAICYDRHFPGVIRALTKQGAQLIFSPAVTFGQKSRRMWELEFEVDAARHNVFIGGSNRLGSEKPWNQEYFGASYFVGPNGRPPFLSAPRELLIADLPLEELADPDPSGWDLARDLRSEIY